MVGRRLVVFGLLAACSRAPERGTADTGVTSIDSTAVAVDSFSGDGAEGGVVTADFLGQKWTHVTGVESCGSLWVASNPAALADTWTDCAGGRVGCSRISVPWAPAKGVRFYVGGRSRVLGAAGYSQTRVVAAASGAPQFGIQIISAPFDAPIFALLMDLSKGYACAANVYAGPTQAVASIATPAEQGKSLRFALYDYKSGSPRTLVLNVGEVVSPTAPVTDLAVSEASLFPMTTTPPAVGVVRMSDGKVVTPILASSPRMQLPRSVAGGAVVVAGSPPGITLVRDDGTVQGLVSIPAPRELQALQSDSVTNDVVWVDGEYRTGDAAPVISDLSLWTGPLTPASPFKPRRVAGFQSAAFQRLESALSVGAGHVVIKIDSRDVVVFRLADGKGWRVKADAGVRWIWPWAIDEAHVWVGASTTSVGEEIDTIYRFRLSDLGPPTSDP